MKTIFRAKRQIVLKPPTGLFTRAPGADIVLNKSDKFTEKGLHLCWGHGLYGFIPRDDFEVITVHTETVKIETLVGEDGRYIETRRV